MTRVKICGLMHPQDVNLCVQAGVHAVGFVVDYPEPVPWNLTPCAARNLTDRLPPFICSTVVTGGSVEKVLKLARSIRPDTIQLHHKETLAEIKDLVRQLKLLGIKTIKALRINSKGKCDLEISDPLAAAQALGETGISALLVDTYTAARPGGTGIPVNLALFKKIRRETLLPVILAGGLTPVNIREVVVAAKPFAVDVLSGVEARPGRKDPEKIYGLMQALNS